ncbi:hybrid sensor histidine kinase/response regulator transcription factor [Postechiella marina]|uniref:histidine kinase n=2 Tax=Postechiella marina TaxID=943941 RepID=A0ABP8CDA3_9FLAO
MWCPTTFYGQFNYTSLFETTDLPTTTVSRVRQDDKGFIWFTSEDGLFKFDGYRYEQHAFINNNPDFPLRGIKKIEFDAYGRIWLVTKDNTLHCYIIETKNLHNIIFKGDGAASFVNSMTINNSKLFVGRGAPYYFSVKNIDFNNINPIPVSGNKSGSRLGYSRSHYAWFVMGEYMVFFDSKKEKLIKTVDMPVKASSICVDKDNNVWIGDGTKRLLKYNNKANVWEEPYQVEGGVRWLEYDEKRNRIWVTSHLKLRYIDLGSLEKELLDLPVSRKFIRNLESFVDKQGNLWMVTVNDLIKINFRGNLSHDSNFEELFNFKNKKVIEQDFSGAMLLATTDSGLIRKNFTTGESKRYLQGKSILCINKVTDSLFLVGTSKGLFEFKFNAKTNNYVSKQKQLDETISAVYAITKSKDHIYWAGYYGGLSRIDYSGDKVKIERVARWSNVGYIVYDSVNNAIITNAINKGIFQVTLNENHEVKNIININQSKNLGSNSVQMIYKTKDNLWVATSLGLSKLKYNKGKEEYVVIKNYTTHDGLSNNYISSVVAENDSILWIGTHNGLNKFNFSKESFTNYYKGFGYFSNRFSDKIAFFSKEKKMFFGVNKGVIAFDPKKFSPSENEYTIFIEDVQINGISGNKTKDLNRLSHYQNNLTFKVSVPNYISPSAIKYRYKVDDGENKWNIKFVKTPSFTLNNLPRGNHKIWLQCTNEDGKWNSEVKTINFTIYPPFWLTWWFIAFWVLVVLGAVILFTRFSIVKQTRKKALNLQLDLEKKLRETDLEKIKFFTNISHDLKTPLTMVKEPLEKVLKKSMPEEEKQFLLETASNNANRLVKLINQVLNFSTIHTGELTLNIQKIEFVGFLKTLLENFKFKAEEKNIDLIFDTQAVKLPLYFDKEKIERVFFNILSNAFKNTPKGGKIILKVRHDQENQSVKVSVEDTGKGISKDKLKEIFSRFFQSNTDAQGQGIGLSIVKEYIEAHEGEVTIESEYQKGTKVLLSLPSEEEKVEVAIEDSKEKTEFKYSILIAEDDDELRKYLTYELSSKYKLFVANNGKRALEIVLNKMPDIVLTDLMMPELNGIELCKKIKGDIRTSHIPTIIITASGKNEIEVLDSGVNDYITKPFKTESLLLKIKNQLTTIKQTKDWFQREIDLTPQIEEIESSGTIFLKNLMQVIEDNFIENKLDISVLTSKMNMSKSSLYKKTSQLAGMTINELITSVKLTKAAELLSKTNYSFNEITFMLGYNDVKYFRELFKKKHELTPTEYRKKHQ